MFLYVLSVYLRQTNWTVDFCSCSVLYRVSIHTVSNSSDLALFDLSSAFEEHPLWNHLQFSKPAQCVLHLFLFELSCWTFESYDDDDDNDDDDDDDDDDDVTMMIVPFVLHVVAVFVVPGSQRPPLKLLSSWYTQRGAMDTSPHQILLDLLSWGRKPEGHRAPWRFGCLLGEINRVYMAFILASMDSGA